MAPAHADACDDTGEKMKTWILILMMLAFPVQAENFIRVGAGVNAMLFSDQEWQDNGTMGCSFGIGNRHRLFGDSWYGEISYHHFSQCFTGPPFDDDYEDNLDAAYYYVEYRW